MIRRSQEAILQAKGLRHCHKRTEESLAELLSEEKSREDAPDDSKQLYAFLQDGDTQGLPRGVDRRRQRTYRRPTAVRRGSEIAIRGDPIMAEARSHPSGTSVVAPSEAFAKTSVPRTVKDMMNFCSWRQRGVTRDFPGCTEPSTTSCWHCRGRFCNAHKSRSRHLSGLENYEKREHFCRDVPNGRFLPPEWILNEQVCRDQRRDKTHASLPLPVTVSVSQTGTVQTLLDRTTSVMKLKGQAAELQSETGRRRGLSEENVR